MTRIIIGLILVTAFSCKTIQIDKDLDRPFIKSYCELNQNSVNILREILKPYEYDNDTLIINKAFKLDVIIDSALYSKQDMQFCYFIGIKFKPDLYDLLIFEIDLKIGAITTCRILPNESLIINNMDYLFTDISNLKKCVDLDIADSLVNNTYKEKPIFRHKAWTNTMYGRWEIDSTSKNKFVDKRFNNKWVFKPEKGFALINDKNDRLLLDSIDLQGNILHLVNSKCKFEIATQTKTKILIRELGSKDFKYLIKEKE